MRIGDADDLAILHGISRGEFATAGFRTRELRLLLHPKAATAPIDEQRRLSAKVGRELRLLRAHELIKKTPRPHRTSSPSAGRLLTAALRATRDANIQQLLREAARSFLLPCPFRAGKQTSRQSSTCSKRFACSSSVFAS